MESKEIVKLLRRCMFSDTLLQMAADRIEELESENNRQQAEIERLEREIENLESIQEISPEAKHFVDTKADKMISLLNELIKSQEQIKAEAIKEFWQQRPPQLNPNQKGKEQYNKGWNDCISFFAEEYEVFLGVKERDVKEMAGDAE